MFQNWIWHDLYPMLKGVLGFYIYCLEQYILDHTDKIIWDNSIWSLKLCVFLLHDLESIIWQLLSNWKMSILLVHIFIYFKKIALPIWILPLICHLEFSIAFVFSYCWLDDTQVLYCMGNLNSGTERFPRVNKTELGNCV